jgi:REP element-mobilizing transposase RayT
MWNDTDAPLAYFFSFHTYGTWLHGDKRGSVDRFHKTYGSPRLPANVPRHNYHHKLLRAPPFTLGKVERGVVREAVEACCTFKKWALLAVNVRTNHVHVIVSANENVKVVLESLKANSTRRLREENLWRYPFSPWVRNGSKRLLWTEESVRRAIDYVLFGQGGELPDDRE